MPMHRRMPIIATTESGSEFSRRCHVRITIQDVADLVRVFLVHASECELCEAFRGFFIKRRCRRVFDGEAKDRKESQHAEQNSHRQECNRFRWTRRSETFPGSAFASRAHRGASPQCSENKSSRWRGRHRQHAKRVRSPELARLLCVLARTSLELQNSTYVFFNPIIITTHLRATRSNANGDYSCCR